MQAIVDLVLHHFRLGYRRTLLFIDGALLLVLLLDLARYQHMGLSVGAAARLAITEFAAAPPAIALRLTTLLVTLPICLGAIRVILGGPERFGRLFSMRSNAITCSHIAASALIASGFVLTHQMATLSGLSITAGGSAYSFRSWLTLGIAPSLQYLLGWGFAVLAMLVPVILEKAAEGNIAPAGLRQYAARATLADLDGRIHPVGGRHVLNFNAAAIAPEVRSVSWHLSKAYLEYQRLGPGSHPASAMVKDAVRDSRRLMVEIFPKLVEHDGMMIEFYPSTTRALEVGLLRARPLSELIVSPFEHPTVVSMVENLGDILHARSFGFGDREGWMRSGVPDTAAFVRDFAAVAPDPATSRALVLSEVCYATGARLDVRAIITLLRASGYAADRLRVIVDGAHAMGSGPKEFRIAAGEYYAFSGHKWLLAPDPCGMLIACPGSSDTLPYDGWGREFPSSTASARTVFGLRASLRLIKRQGLDSLLSRSDQLRTRFVELSQQDLAVVGGALATWGRPMLAVEPAAGRRWKHAPEELRRALLDRKISVEVLTISPRVPWIRVMFPYFVDMTDLEKFAKVLCSYVERIV